MCVCDVCEMRKWNVEINFNLILNEENVVFFVYEVCSGPE